MMQMRSYPLQRMATSMAAKADVKPVANELCGGQIVGKIGAHYAWPPVVQPRHHVVQVHRLGHVVLNGRLCAVIARFCVGAAHKHAQRMHVVGCFKGKRLVNAHIALDHGAVAGFPKFS